MNQRTDRICRWNRHLFACSSSTHPVVCTPRAKFERSPLSAVNISLVLLFKWLTRTVKPWRGAQKTVEVGLIFSFCGRKNFSHRRTNFPSNSLLFGPLGDQWMRELEAKQM